MRTQEEKEKLILEYKKSNIGYKKFAKGKNRCSYVFMIGSENITKKE